MKHFQILLLTAVALLIGEGAVHIHLRRGDRYRVLIHGKAKETRYDQWWPCIVYFSLTNGAVYTSGPVRFANNFAPLHPEAEEAA